MVFLILATGLRAASGAGTIQAESNAVSFIAAFAGFKWDWAMTWLQDAVKSLQAQKK